MADLVAFITARLDEDQQSAQRAITASGGQNWRASDSGIYPEDDPSHHPGPFIADAYGYTDPEYGGHIARHDPARSLREIAAKRKLLWLHSSDHNDDTCDTCRVPRASCRTLLAMAAIWSDHPDYQTAWSLT